MFPMFLGHGRTKHIFPSIINFGFIEKFTLEPRMVGSFAEGREI